MNRFSAFVTNAFIMAIFFGVSSFSFRLAEQAGLSQAMRSVCSRLETDYVRKDEPRVQDFIAICLAETSAEVRRAMSGDYGDDSRRALIYLLNERLSALRVSHLAAFAPDETTAIWTGEALDTGARAKIVDGEIVVTRTLYGSSAARAGVRHGDIVIAVDGVPVPDPSDLEHMSGVWEVLKPDETRVSVPVEATVLQESIVPTWVRSQEITGVRVLKIPTFLPQAFDNDEWPKVRDQLTDMQKRGERLLLDLRGNRGGSFPAMLRVLGALKCDHGVVGWVYRGKPPTGPPVKSDSFELPDDLNADLQLDLLNKNGAIALAPFKSEACFTGPVGILIDQGTSSVAEIFAQALKERPRTLVAGWRSSGHVVMARWFQIAGLSQDYTVSIPIALYRSAKGEELESRGVSPDQLLTDNLKRWRSTRDPWIADLIRATVSL